MPHRTTWLKAIAVIYGVVVLSAAAWAIAVDVRMLNSDREHLLPSIVLAFVAMPGSLTLGPVYERWPSAFSGPLGQVGWLTVCGLLQAALLFAVGSLQGRRSNAA